MDFLLSLFFIPKQTQYVAEPPSEVRFVALEAPLAPPKEAPKSLEIEEKDENKEYTESDIKTLPDAKFEAVEGIELEVKELIIKYSKKYKIDPLLPLSVAWAESQFRNVPNHMYDGEKGKYTAWGIFQETRTFYKGFCGDPDERKIIEKNIECAIKVIANEKNALNHWSESYELNGKGWKYLGYRSQ